MKIIVNPHTILLDKTPVNELELNVTKCKFEFAEEITNDFVKEAYFTLDNGNTYKKIIINNECDIPGEVLEKKGGIELGVVAYLVENETEIKRYNPSPAYFDTWLGSLRDAENSEPITPSEMEQYEQALQDGLAEVNDKLDEIDQALDDVTTAIEETNNLDLDVSKEGKTATVTLTKKDATTKTVTLSDGTSLMFNWDGTRLGIKTDEDADYTYVDLQGVQGPIGPKGEAFTIKKTYSSVAEMNADFNNMQLGDYVMIASTVEIEDNAKLYTRGENQWIFISDFSGATGIKGETGATPNIQIGTVTSGTTPSVTRSGTNENPVLNFVLVKGDTGSTGPQGETGATGNGIASITKTSTSGLVDTYTITYTDGTTSTFEVTNGEDGEVTQEQLDETNAEVERAKMVYNALPKVTGTGTEITLNDIAECPMPMSLRPSATSQATSILPDGYTQVNYIEATGLQLINTNYVPTQNTVVEVDFKSNKTADEPFTSLFGVQYSGTEGRFYVLFGSTNTIQVNIPRNALQYACLLENGNIEYNNAPSTGAYWTNDRAKYVLDIANKIVKINDRTWDLSRLTGDFVSPANSLRLLSRFNGNTGTPDANRSKGLLYGAKIYEGTTLLHNYIPCYRNSDNEVGVYDIVGDSFYASSSTTPFTYGSVATLPNPDYPQDIHTVSGNNVIKVTTGNLSDDIFQSGNAYGPSGTRLRLKNTIPITKGKIYKLSYNGVRTDLQMVINTNSIATYGWSVYDYCGNDTTWVTAHNNIIRFTATNNGYLSIILAYVGNGTINPTDNIDFDKFLLVEEQTLPLNLGTIELCKIGNYEDYFYKDSGKWYLKKVIDKAILNGTEAWDYYSQGRFWYVSSLFNYLQATNMINAYCNKYKAIREATDATDFNTASGNNTHTISFASDRDSLRIRDYDIPTDGTILQMVQRIKKKLQTEQPILYYILATPTDTEITDTTLISQLEAIYNWATSYQDQTNITQVNDDLPFVITATGIRDLSNIFDLISGTEL